jgi:hypothetical protein
MEFPQAREVISLTVTLMAGIKKVLPLMGETFHECIGLKRVFKSWVQGYYIIQEYFIGIAWKIFFGARK